MSGSLSDLQLPPYIQAKPPIDELRAASVRFLFNAKARFGDHSSQLHRIHETLDAFQKSKLSKRDTHKAIFDTLEGHSDLKQDLMNVLLQPAADWHPSDFDVPTECPLVPLSDSAPRFLQPAHEPQMRLPALSSNWFAIPQVEQHTEFVNFNSHNHLINSPPSLPAPAPIPQPYVPLQAWIDNSGENSYMAQDDDVHLLPRIQTAFRDPWQMPEHVNPRQSDERIFPSTGIYLNRHFETEPSPCATYSHDPQPPLFPSQGPGSYQMLTPNLHDAYLSPRTYLPTYDDLSFSDEDDVSHDTSRKDVGMALPSPVSKSPEDIQQTQDREAVGHNGLTDQIRPPIEYFVHALCGKGFMTLSGVKKHHWGKKINDPTTTTGCWAKHKKPNVAWDEHPSCHEGRSGSGTFQAGTSKPRRQQPKASMSESISLRSSVTPHLNPVPGFPTLSDLPDTVAKVISTATENLAGEESRMLLYQDRRVSSRSGLEDNLTAASVFPQIDAPKPRALTSSIAVQLYGKVAATEQQAPVAQDFLTSTTQSTNVPSIASFAMDNTGHDLTVQSPQCVSANVSRVHVEEQVRHLSCGTVDAYSTSAVLRPIKPFKPLKPREALSSGSASKKRKL